MIRRRIRFIVWHCTATPNGQHTDAEKINNWHAQRGFHRKSAYRERLNYRLEAFGYHGIIYPSGFYQSGRHFDEWGAHVRGSNSDSIGFAMAGTDQFTPEQWTTARFLTINTLGLIANELGVYDRCESAVEANRLAKKIGIEVLGHRDFSPDLDGDGQIEAWEWLKTCPGFDVRRWFDAAMLPPPGHIYRPEA